MQSIFERTRYIVEMAFINNRLQGHAHVVHGHIAALFGFFFYQERDVITHSFPYMLLNVDCISVMSRLDFNQLCFPPRGTRMAYLLSVTAARNSA